MSKTSLPSSPASVPPSTVEIKLSPIAGIVFVAFLVSGLASCLWAIVNGRIDLLPFTPDWEQFADGELTHRIAEDLSNAAVPEGAARLERAATWLTLGDTGDRVRPGCPGWLFLADELKVHAQAEANAQRKAQVVADIDRQLAQRGIELLVVVVPDKSRIAADQLCGVARPASFAGRIDAWQAMVQGNGVPLLNLAPVLQPLGSDGYLRTDSHWNEAGAAAAAKAVATQVAELGIEATPAKTVTTRQADEAVRPGDLVRLAGLDWLPAPLQPTQERLRETRFEEIAAAPSDDLGLDDLFGDSNLPNVALIGTSFSRNSNFVGFLEQALGASIGNFAKDGGEFSGAASDYFPGTAFQQTPPALVIWEIPERDLQSPRLDAISLEAK